MGLIADEQYEQTICDACGIGKKITVVPERHAPGEAPVRLLIQAAARMFAPAAVRA